MGLVSEEQGQGTEKRQDVTDRPSRMHDQSLRCTSAKRRRRGRRRTERERLDSTEGEERSCWAACDHRGREIERERREQGGGD